VQYTIQTRKVNLLVIDQDKRNRQSYVVDVDSKLLELTVSVSGANPQVTLIDPSSEFRFELINGKYLVTIIRLDKHVNSRTRLTRLLQLKEVFILNMKHPMVIFIDIRRQTLNINVLSRSADGTFK
jgi:hypothetical protein